MNSFVIVVLALAAAQANVVYRKLKVEDRIVGGQIAVPHSFPYQAFMLVSDAIDDTFQCGGSLLSTTKILTAAHCVKDYFGIVVLLGAHQINKFEATQQRKYGIEYAYHSDFNEQTFANDIAIVTLDSPVELNREYYIIRSITLPTRADIGNTYVGALATVSGWGKYSDASSSTSALLRFVSSPVVSNTVCSMDHHHIFPSQICIDGSLLKSSCKGDSGGPLVTGADRVQIGVVSFGRAEGCEYLDWIVNTGGVKIN